MEDPSNQMISLVGYLDKSSPIEIFLKIVLSQQVKARIGLIRLFTILRFVIQSKSNFKVLYTTYVRPHLDYCVQAVGPVFKQDINALEKIQCRATKLVKRLQNVSYQERLKQLNLSSMGDRIRRGDMVETYKLLTRKVKAEPSQFFDTSQDTRSRGHTLKLKKRRSRLLLRSHFFSNRTVNFWNKLPDEVVSARSTNEFKNKFDSYIVGKDLEYP